MSYTGRFAPSPSGPLHFGSMVAAVASYLDAKAHNGRWLVCMEDLDPPREVTGAADGILRTLERWHLHWDGPVLYQSTRLDAYRQAMDQLLETDMAYRCRCTRRDVARLSTPTCAGECRQKAISASQPHCVRIGTGRQGIGFVDALQGPQQQMLAVTAGDYVIWRRDGLCAYQLGVTVDDEYQGITHIVRGADLLDSTPRQIHLRVCLGYKTPVFAHIAMALNTDRQKLSKQTGAAAIDVYAKPRLGLYLTLLYLQQNPPAELAQASVDEQLRWATLNWNSSPLRHIAAFEINSDYKVVATHRNYVATQRPEV